MIENQHIEWKESWRDEYLKWVCAFANAQGGVLEIGDDVFAAEERSDLSTGPFHFALRDFHPIVV